MREKLLVNAKSCDTSHRRTHCATGPPIRRITVFLFSPLPISRRIHLSTDTFDKVAEIIAETSEVSRQEITADSHAIDDLGIDSLDFLDIVYAVDKEFGIKVPLEAWTQEINEGKASTDDYFILKNMCARIDDLRASKSA
ncbi:MAG: acyl carrier protein [Alphaproteobacteria bacterium]|nr:MAG: acyl carrier protein [Alphaproteobacteria bacterium]